ncbi:hypothetical protein BJV82DRAFT_239033 [Fennellomyces sp. T-0311]|nr:hypothetical protein BJV82DRAFT_239033 [Fennellomyces sp. T-0311]
MDGYDIERLGRGGRVLPTLSAENTLLSSALLPQPLAAFPRHPISIMRGLVRLGTGTLTKTKNHATCSLSGTMLLLLCQHQRRLFCFVFCWHVHRERAAGFGSHVKEVWVAQAPPLSIVQNTTRVFENLSFAARYFLFWCASRQTARPCVLPHSLFWPTLN